MRNLIRRINQLEQEINQNRQAVYLQYHYTKLQLTEKLTSPPLFLIAFISGGLIGKKIKRTLKKRPSSSSTHTPEKKSFLQKIIALSSEISIAINLYNRLKHTKDKLIQKTDDRIPVRL